MSSTSSTRTNAILTFYIGLVFALAGIALNIPVQRWAMPLWAIGLCMAAAGSVGLQRSLSRSDQDASVADEYQRERIDSAKSIALNFYFYSTGALMLVLLMSPLLDNAGISSATWSELARTLGMVTGLIFLTGAFLRTYLIARGVTADEQAEAADSQVRT